MLFTFNKKVSAQYDCCGNGVCEWTAECNWEDSNNCPVDCDTSASPSPGGGYCGDEFCDKEGLGGPKEACDQCVQDCGVCAPDGWQECGTGTCSDGQTYWIHCTPSCDDPNQTCYNTPSCDWPPSNCNQSCADLGNPDGWSSAPCDSGTGSCCCPSEPNCPGEGDCGVVVCGVGGNCYSNCDDCFVPSPSPSPSPPDFPCQEVGPAAPELVSPANGTTDIHSSTVTLDWNEVSSWGTACCDDGTTCTGDNWPSCCPDREYRLYMDLSSPPGGSAFCTNNPGNTNCNVPIFGVNQTHYWRVCADNGAYAAGVSCSDIWSFTPTNTPPSNPTNGSPDGELNTNIVSFQWDHDGNWGINIDGNVNRFYVDWREASGSYDWTNPACDDLGEDIRNCGPFTFDWGTTYYWKVRASNNGNDFSDPNTYADSEEYTFTPMAGSWWQTVGGDIYGANGITSIIPDTALEPYLMLNDPSSGYHGIAIYGDGSTLDIGTYVDNPENIAEGGPDWRAESSYGGKTYDYDWWEYHLRNESKSNTGASLASISSDGVYTLTSNNLQGALGSGRKVVILSDHDITINGNISVPEGSFLMVVVDGKITIDDNIGEDAGGPALTGTTANVQGIFIANEIDTGSGDKHLWAAGSFIGWNGVTLGRDFDSVDNNTEPSMTFIFRPDFLINAPDYAKKVYYPRWEQVPG